MSSNLFDIGGAAIGAAANLWAVNETNEANERLQHQQNQHNLEMWRLNNEYNSPVQQMERLKRAGLNPDMMYSQGQGNAVGNSSSPAQTQSPFPHMPQSFDPKLSAEISNLMADTYKKKMEGIGQDKQNEIVEKTGLQQAMANLQYTQASIDNMVQHTSNLHTEQDKLKEEIENYKKAREQMDASIAKTLQETQNLKAEEATEQQALQLLIAQTEGQRLNNAQQEIINEWLPKKYCQEIAEGYKRIEKMDSDILKNTYDNAYTFANTCLAEELAKTEKEKQNNISEDTKLKASEVALNKIDERTRHVKNIVGIVAEGASAFEDITKGVLNVKKTFFDKGKTKNIGKTVKKATTTYKFLSGAVK